MGSSPVTATTPPSGALDEVTVALAGCLREHAIGGEPIVVAFSGGPDSLALLLAAKRVAPTLALALVAAHVDHRLDPGSAARAEGARSLAAQVDVPFRLLVAPAGSVAAGESREAAPRRVRYRLLDELRRELGARWLLTAHHADDQAETVLLRLAQGSGLAGLAGMAVRHETVLRPLLSLQRRELLAALAASRLVPLDDPTNRDLAVPRNHLRHRVLPALGEEVASSARAVAAAAATLGADVERRLLALLPDLAGDDVVDDVAPGSPHVPLDSLRRLPPELLPWALALLHRRAGAGYPPRAAAVAELRRQLAAAGRVACDCGGGWRWRTDAALRLRVEAAPTSASPFTYTVEVPVGVEIRRVEIREIGTTFRLSRQPVAAWMRRGAPSRAALDLSIAAGGRAPRVTVRSRRAGDRLQPLGTPHRRRLKELLIDRKVPRETRDRLPLLCVDGDLGNGDQVAWVPGVTIHHPFRLREGAATAWVAELGES
ncbi:MAG TPA: tRNA lysidine(34) synthetase TilS [Thermoanaerobaculia bacterium]|nr:tRNA lysidine(34) synthetase TilS [Thermoanaerobaculia bacterium]